MLKVSFFIKLHTFAADGVILVEPEYLKDRKGELKI